MTNNDIIDRIRQIENVHVDDYEKRDFLKHQLMENFVKWIADDKNTGVTNQQSAKLIVSILE